MGEIRNVGSGKTSGYPYPVCKKAESFLPMHCNKVPPRLIN